MMSPKTYPAMHTRCETQILMKEAEIVSCVDDAKAKACSMVAFLPPANQRNWAFVANLSDQGIAVSTLPSPQVASRS